MNINNLIQGRSTTLPQSTNLDSLKTSKNDGEDTFKSLLTKTKGQIPCHSARIDRFQFSNKPVQNTELELSSLSKKISKDLKLETTSEKIQRISSQIENNEYKVDHYELATIMFRI